MVIIFALLVFDVWFPYAFISAPCIFFFLAGAYCKVQNIDIMHNTVVKSKGYTVLFVIALIVAEYFLFKDMVYAFDYALRVFTLIGVGAAFRFSYLLTKKREIVSNALISSTFFIYAMHYAVFPIFEKITCKILGESCYVNPNMALIAWLMTSTLCLLACLFTYYLLNKYMPTICKILTGGR